MLIYDAHTYMHTDTPIDAPFARARNFIRV